MGVARIALIIARLSGAAVLALGLVFWTGHGQSLISAHMAFGVILVFSLWTLAGIGFRKGVSGAAVAIAVAWGIVVPILGAVQLILPSGGGYGPIRALHLIVGLGAIAQAESLARQAKLTDRTSGDP